MSDIVETPDTPPEPEVIRAAWALAALGGVAALVLIIGLIVWLTSDDDQVATVSTSSTTTSMPESTSIPESTSSTSTPSTTTSSTTTSSTTSSSTTVAPTTTAPAVEFELPAPGAGSWTVPLFDFPGTSELTLTLAATDGGGVSAYDGTTDQVRCVALVGPGDSYTGWCGPNATATRFVADRGAASWLVEVGAAAGDVTFTEQDQRWTLASNGCGAPTSVILAAVDPGPWAVTGIVCAGDESFVGIGPLHFGDVLAPDGAGILVGRGDEGWDSISGFGTSIGCADLADGVDRCDRFGVEFELFEALLPPPPAGVLGGSAVDVVAVTDRTSDVRAWIGDATDPAEIDTIVVAQLVDPDAEVPAKARRADLGRRQLVAVEIPQLDDSSRFETWAVWIGSDEEAGDIKAFSWATCARGVTGDGLCV